MKQIFFILIFCHELFANSFNSEDSPYLKQHINNPVNWYAWNKNSLNLAKKENKLIFVSIGYSTCHWCHVMRKESFENKQIANALNKDYISIKIDREELPHIDSFYQDILKKLTNKRNGWPLNFILTPKKEMIYISTYIPSIFTYDTEGMDTLIPRIAYDYKNKILQKLIKENKSLLDKKIKKQIDINKSLEYEYVKVMEKNYDDIYYGFGTQTKFPLAMNLKLLYEISLLEKKEHNKKAYMMFKNSMDALSLGGIFDHIEGGFYRYSVYKNWNIPHFEKMLYTQGELLPLFLKLYLKTNNTKYKNIIIKTVNNVNENFKTKDGLYYSASDADSINEEGKKQEGYYFTYKYDNVKEEFIKNDINNYEEVLEYLSFDDFGNFNDELNNVFINEKSKKVKNIDKALEILKKIRINRKKPFIDKKIITSWNALMIKAMYELSVLDRKYLKQAEKSMSNLLKQLYINKVLYHKKVHSTKPNQKALLEDYSFLIDSLLSAYQSTYKKEYLSLAKNLSDEVLDKFYKNKKWYMDEENEYEVSFSDKYYVSAISRMFNNLLSISNLLYDLEFLQKSKALINEQKNMILLGFNEYPEALGALIRLKYGDVVIKSNKRNLLEKTKEISMIKYPFLLENIEETKLYLACDEKTCFAYDKDLKKLIKEIEK